MAKEAKKQKYLKHLKERERLASKRAEWKALAFSAETDPDERLNALKKLVKTRAASSVRTARRCNLNGRPRGVYRRVGLSRNEFRRLVMEGLVPGFSKASW